MGMMGQVTKNLLGKGVILTGEHLCFVSGSPALSCPCTTCSGSAAAVVCLCQGDFCLEEDTGTRVGFGQGSFRQREGVQRLGVFCSGVTAESSCRPEVVVAQEMWGPCESIEKGECHGVFC